MAFEAVLLDIEGTTTPISFVYSTLFPYAASRLHDFVVEHFEEPDVHRAVDQLFREYEHEKDDQVPNWAAPEDMEGAVAYLLWLMEQDRKSTGLKAIQGLIWEEGFRQGALSGAVFDDVPEALRRWTSSGKNVYIFSSGSVLAQKLIFSRTAFGDLSNLLSGYFDTEIGPKRETSSYSAIAREIGLSPSSVLFISDVPEELAAASAAGMQTLLAMRPGNKEVNAADFKRVESFSVI